MADSHAGAGELSELAYYYPEPFWLAQESSWIKSLLLFFDGVAILLPNYMKGRELVEDPSLAGPLTDRGLLMVLEPEWFVDEPLSTRLAEGMVELLLANARWPAAFESAYFAREETAKSANMFAAAYIVAEDAAQLNWPEFWNMWKDHKKKSAIFVMMSRLMSACLSRPLPTPRPQKTLTPTRRNMKRTN